VGAKAVASPELRDDIAALVNEAKTLLKSVARRGELLDNVGNGIAAYDELTEAIVVAIKSPTDASWNRLMKAYRVVSAVTHAAKGVKGKIVQDTLRSDLNQRCNSHTRIDTAIGYYQYLQRVKNYIDQNSSRHMSLVKAAEVAGLEEKYFSTYFHNKTGVCFKDWLSELRVNEAKALMEVQNYTISEIAFAVGFHNLRTFERAFKRCTGMTPRTFKNSVRPS
jgi:AraC-like DNA-binding protein